MAISYVTPDSASEAAWWHATVWPGDEGKQEIRHRQPDEAEEREGIVADAILPRGTRWLSGGFGSLGLPLSSNNVML
jgi:hypothetical protein